MNKLERLTAEILLLQERKRGSEELAEILEVSKRTIIRDIQALSEMGVPVIAQDGVAGGYWLPEEYSLQPLQLTWKEAMLLMLALSGISKMADAPFAPERITLEAKIQSILPEKHRQRVEGLLEKVAIDVPERPQRSPLLETLVEAAENDEWILARYKSSENETEFAIKPERVYADRGFWYVRARTSGASRTYRVDRFVSATPTDPPQEKAVEEVPYDHPSHPTIRVTLTPAGARRVENDPHIGPTVRDEPGPQTLEFRCPPSELDWYARYFGAMGKDAVVEAPPELVARIIERTKEILGIYLKR